jgi:thioesterase domain-containing protein
MLGSVLDFLRLIDQARVTVLNLPTAFWHELVQGLKMTEASLPASVRLVVVGGEKASASALSSWLQLTGPQVRWLNTYGPTEATVSATLYEPAVHSWNPFTEIPIGRPLPNVQAYVLDRERRAVPVGVPGELYLGGVGIARGYLRRPEATTEKFIPHPFSPDPKARLYRTGDQARYLPDGNLEFLGRFDSQIKLRGLRVELGEIETALGQHPAVRDAVVLAHDTASGDKQLVGYVVPQGRETLTTELLHAFLRDCLPAYMTPTRFVMLDALPLTPSGKIDRRALPALDSSLDVVTDVVAPRDQCERGLTKIWEELFQRRPIGIRDNFFALGGHSLLAIRMLSKVQQMTGQRIPLAALFKEGTIEQLAALLRQTGQSPRSCLVGIQPQGTKPPFFCVHGAGGGVFWYADLARRMGSNQPFYGIESPGVEDPRAIEASIETLAARYLQAIRTVQPQGPYCLGGYSMGGIIAFEMARQLRAGGQTVALLAVFDTWGPGSQLSFAERLFRVAPRFWRMSVKHKEEFLRAKYQWLTNSAREWWTVGVLDRKMWRLQRLKRANIQAVRAYTPRPYAGALTLFRAETQRVTSEPDPYLGWRQLATGGIKIHEIPGDHYSMFVPPNSRVLAEQLLACLEKAQRPPRPDDKNIASPSVVLSAPLAPMEA